MKKFTILALLLALAISVNLQAQGKIGYINPQEVLEQLPETAAIEAKLNEFVQLKQAEFSQREEQFLSKVRQLQEQMQAQLISEQELTRQRGLLEEEQEELYALLDSHQLELRQRQQQLLEPVLTSIDDAIEAVAIELGLDYVLNELTNNGELILLFVSNQGKNSLNITDKVVQKLK
jgi:outer membrane protein